MLPPETGNTEPESFPCGCCGEVNHMFVDPSRGEIQKYIEDCQVCCRPNELRVSYDEWNKKVMIRARQSQ